MNKRLISTLLERFGEPLEVNLLQETCSKCGMMSLEIDNDAKTCCQNESDEELTQKAPPGKEKLVKALKKNPDIDNPWAVAWSIHNKQKK